MRRPLFQLEFVVPWVGLAVAAGFCPLSLPVAWAADAPTAAVPEVHLSRISSINQMIARYTNSERPPCAPAPATELPVPPVFVCAGDPDARNQAECEESFCRLPAKDETGPVQNIPQGYVGTPREAPSEDATRVFEIRLRTQLISNGKPLSERESQAEMPKIQACYDQASFFTSGTLPDGSPARIRFKMVQGGIEAHPEDGRRYDSLFAAPLTSDMGCETLLQETILDIGSTDDGSGLGDEYPITERADRYESQRSGGPLTDRDSCRTIGPGDSLMRRRPDHAPVLTRFARASIESGGYRLASCNCPSYRMFGSDLRKCMSEIARLASQSKSGRFESDCPAATVQVPDVLFTQLQLAGSSQRRQEQQAALDAHLERGKMDEDGVSFTWLQKLSPAPLAQRSSILYPAQFRKLLFPGCKRLNAVYDSCAAGADLLNRKNPCPARAAACKDGSDEWLR